MKKISKGKKKDINILPKLVILRSDVSGLFGIPDLPYTWNPALGIFEFREPSGLIRGAFTKAFYIKHQEHFKELQDDSL